MSDRIAVMNRGRVEQLGTPEELYERPTTRFVADFIGTTNLLIGTVESVDAEHAIVRLASGEPCVVGRADLAVGRSIELSIRPESVELRPPGGHVVLAGPHRRHRRAGRLPRRQRPVPRPLQRRARDHRSRAEDRATGSPVGDAVNVSWDAGRGARPRRHAIEIRRRIRHERAIRRVDASTSRRRSSGTWSSVGSAGGSCSSGSPRLVRRRHSRRSSPPARAPLARRAPRRLRAPLRRRPEPSRRPSPSPTPVPSPEAELFIYNWTDYLADEVIESFEAKYGTKVTQSFFSNTDEAYAKLGDDGGGYDLSFPISVDMPSFIEKGAIVKLDRSLVHEHRQPGRRVVRPGLRPGQHLLRSLHVVDDRRRLRLGQDHRRADELEGALGSALGAAHLDARRLPGGLRAGAHPARLLGEHRAHATSSTRRSTLLQEQKPLVRTYSTDTIATMTSGDVWIGHIWGADRFAIQEVNENVLYYIPEEGGDQGLGHGRRVLRARSTRSPLTCSSTTCSTRRTAPPTRTSSTTWARTPRPRSSSTRRSSRTRRSIRTRRSSTSSRSCCNLDAAAARRVPEALAGAAAEAG